MAAVLVVYGIGFAFATAAAGLSEALPLWLSLLIVTGVILVLAALADSSPDDQRARRRHRNRLRRSRKRSRRSRRCEAMSERTPEQIRLEIASERQALDEDLSNLQSEIRSLAVVRRRRPRRGWAGLLADGQAQGRRDRLEACEVAPLAARVCRECS